MLTDCQYVPHAHNDGDSFCVRCGAKEFIVRLYFVDAPETNLQYPERTREQAEYFGTTLDQTMTVRGEGPIETDVARSEGFPEDGLDRMVCRSLCTTLPAQTRVSF